MRLWSDDGVVVGAGFLAAEDLICTCAHVVADALGLARETVRPPDARIRLDFPFLDGSVADAVVEAWEPVQTDGSGDVAVLRLRTTAPTGARPPRLLPTTNLKGRPFEVFGVPEGADEGRWSYGVLMDALPGGWVPMEAMRSPGTGVQPGFSGAPVWDPNGRGWSA